MRLCFISSLLPDGDPSTGYEIANQAILDGYRRNGVELTVAGFRRPGARPAAPGEIDLGEIPIENASVGPARKIGWVASAFLRNLPVAAAKVGGLGRGRLLQALSQAGPVDGFVLNSIQMPAAYPWLVSERPSIFIAHNVEHHSAAENARNARRFGTTLLYRREAELLRRAEERIAREAVVVHTLSRDDAAGLGLAEDEKCLPLALSLGRPAPPSETERAYDIGLLGTWSWAPNRVGLDWFVEEVVPQLAPDIRIAIAGRFDGAPPAAPGNVSFLGRVENAQEFVRSCRVIALATKGGTGVQLKTIETFEEGLPAVATPEALRGVDHVPDNVQVAHTPAEFAASLAELVASDRGGRLARLDGSRFAAMQRAAMDAALKQGLERFEAARGRIRRYAVPGTSPLPTAPRYAEPRRT